MTAKLLIKKRNMEGIDCKNIFLPYKLKTGDIPKNRIIYPNAQQSMIVGPESWPTEATIDDLCSAPRTFNYLGQAAKVAQIS